MKVELSSATAVKKVLKVEAPPALVKEKYQSVLETFQKNTFLKGFRKGKVPRELILRYRRQELLAQVKQALLRQLYPEAIKKFGLKTVGRPVVKESEIEGKLENGQFAFKVEVEIEPEFQLPPYRGLKLTQENPVVSEEEVEKELQALQERYAEYISVKARGAQKGDYVNLSYQAFYQGRRIRLPLPIGKFIPLTSDIFPEPLFKEIIGLKENEEKKCRITTPELFNGRELELQVKLQGIREKKLPVLDDNFARKTEKAESLAELKQKIKERLLKIKETASYHQLKKQALDILVNSSSIELPESLVLEEINRLFLEVKKELKKEGYSEEEIRNHRAQLQEKLKARAEQNLRSYYLLTKIAEQEKLTVSQAEIEEYLQKNFKLAPEEISRMPTRVEATRKSLLQAKALDFVIAQAKIQKVTPK